MARWSQLGYASPPRAANIFKGGRWRALALIISYVGALYAINEYYVKLVLAGPLRLSQMCTNAAAKIMGSQPPNMPMIQLDVSRTPAKWIYRGFHAANRRLPTLSWVVLLTISGSNSFFEEYCDAWRHRLEERGSVFPISVCLGQDMLKVPILFDPHNRNVQDIGSDRETFEMLRMWYNYMQLTRGFAELLLPRTLVRIFAVTPDGKRGDAYDLGGFGSSHVANFENPLRVPEDQRDQTEKIEAVQGTHGLEFVRVWNSTAVSAISLAPFVLSMIFVVTQTAFTVAAFIVTAGALIVALFGFLDSMTDKVK